jgi:uncharacterized protein YndB with AHSA1/START domain
MTASTITPAPVRHSVHVKASPAKAFDVFTGGMNRWWAKSHKIGPADLKTIVMEPRAGGRWYEIDDDGSTCEWGKVLAWEPPHRVVLAWQITPDFTYDRDLLTEVEITFNEEADGTLVSLEHRNLERFGERMDAMRGAVNAGWPMLLGLFAAEADS